MQIGAIGFQILYVSLSEVLLVASSVACLPVSILKLLVHIDDFVHSLSFSVVHWVVTVESPKRSERRDCTRHPMIAKFENWKVADSEDVRVLVFDVIQVHSYVLELDFGMVEKHTNGLSLAKTIVVIKFWSLHTTGRCLIHLGFK